MKYHEKFIAGDSRTKGSLFFLRPSATGYGLWKLYETGHIQFSEADTFKAKVPTWDEKINEKKGDGYGKSV